MCKVKKSFVCVLVFIELSFLLGTVAYFLAHTNVQAIETQAIETEDTKPLNKKIINTRNSFVKSLAAINVGGPYTTAAPYSVSIYRAKKGDNLALIASRNNLDLYTMLSVNGLKSSNDISIGQRLKIPNQRGIIHKVRKGESLEDIALLYNVNVRKIIRVNQIFDVTAITAGTELFIPDARTTMAFQRELLEKSGIIQSEKTDKKSNRMTRVARQRVRTTQAFVAMSKLRVNSEYGFRRDPFTGQREFHAGIDYDMDYGAPVKAIMGGVVTYAGWMGGYGKLVVVTSENGYSMRYGHLSRINVRLGSVVKEGQVLGAVGSTGRSTGPHLHLEVRKDNEPINPARFLSSLNANESEDLSNGSDKQKGILKTKVNPPEIKEQGLQGQRTQMN